MQFLNWIQNFRTPAGDVVWVWITKTADKGFIWILLTVILLAVPKTRKSGLVLATALILNAILSNGILKNVFARMRPCDVNTAVDLLIRHPHDFSFPSGHTACSFAAASALYFAGEKRLWKPALLLAVLIAFSRMYLYVHYPSDILGGMLFGAAAGYIAYRVVDKFWNKIAGCFKNKHGKLQ